MVSRPKHYLTFLMIGLVLLACSNGITRFYNKTAIGLVYKNDKSSINGIVLDQNQQPIINAKIQLLSVDQTIEGQSDKHGRFTLPSNLPGDSLRLKISADNYTLLDYQSVSIKELTCSDWQFCLANMLDESPPFDSIRCSIQGLVKDPYGNPIPGACVRIVGTQYGSVSGMNGEFYFINIPTGYYEFSFRAVGYRKAYIRNCVVSQTKHIIINQVLFASVLGDNKSGLGNPYSPIDKYSTSNSWSTDSAKLSTSPAKNINQALKACPGISR
jgi:hypothetical protein